MLFEDTDVGFGHHMIRQPGNYLDSGQVPTVYRAVVGHPTERLEVVATFGSPVEPAPQNLLHFVDSQRGVFGQNLGKRLIVQVSAADDRVPQVDRGGVAGLQRCVVAALDHPGASALPEQTFDDDHHIQVGGMVSRPESREQAGATRSDNRDVRGQFVQCRVLKVNALRTTIRFSLCMACGRARSLGHAAKQSRWPRHP